MFNLNLYALSVLFRVVRDLFNKYRFHSEIVFDEFCNDNEPLLVIEYDYRDSEKIHDVFGSYIFYAFGDRHIKSFVLEVPEFPKDNDLCKMIIKLKF